MRVRPGTATPSRSRRWRKSHEKRWRKSHASPVYLDQGICGGTAQDAIWEDGMLRQDTARDPIPLHPVADARGAGGA